jgi:hypothetical protein
MADVEVRIVAWMLIAGSAAPSAVAPFAIDSAYIGREGLKAAYDLLLH